MIQHDLGFLMTLAVTLADWHPRSDTLPGIEAGTPHQAPADRFGANVASPVAE